MRHLFSRGFYKPMGVSRRDLAKITLLLLRPEIYGSIAEDTSRIKWINLCDRTFTGRN